MEKQEKQLLLDSGNSRNEPKKNIFEKFINIFNKKGEQEQ